MKQPYDALLFDMDGVLVDVTQSYRKAIQQTAQYFLKRKVDMFEVNEIKKKVGMNNDWDATYALINKNKLNELFNIIVAMEDTKRGKPSPEPINKAMELLNVTNTVYIGDSPSDTIAAMAAGIPSIYIGKENKGTINFKSVLQVIEYLL